MSNLKRATYVWYDTFVKTVVSGLIVLKKFSGRLQMPEKSPYWKPRLSDYYEKEVPVMTFGVSSACFYPKPTEQAVELLGKAGIHQIEIFYNSFSELEQPFTYRLKELLRRYDMEVKSVHPFSSAFEPYMFFTDYERRFQDILEFYKQYYDCMNQLGAEILVFHGDRKDSFFPEEQYFERFFRLTEQAASYGITVAQENVARCRSHSTLFLKRMCQALPNASFVLDIKQAVRSRQDPFELVELFGKRLALY